MAIGVFLQMEGATEESANANYRVISDAQRLGEALKDVLVTDNQIVGSAVNCFEMTPYATDFS